MSSIPKIFGMLPVGVVGLNLSCGRVPGQVRIMKTSSIWLMMSVIVSVSAWSMSILCLLSHVTLNFLRECAFIKHMVISHQRNEKHQCENNQQNSRTLNNLVVYLEIASKKDGECDDNACKDDNCESIERAYTDQKGAHHK